MNIIRRIINHQKKKVIKNITEILIESGSLISFSTLSMTNPSAGIIISSSTASLTSTAVLNTKEDISKLKIR